MTQQQQTNCNYLAIACVPIQAWGQTYRPEDAFLNGTIFPELNMPFNAKINTVQGRTREMNDQNQLLLDIQIVSFVVKDVQLFLDTHPACEAALDFFKYYNNLLTALTDEYEAKFGPLTVYSVDTENGWTWIDEPWPWEKEA